MTGEIDSDEVLDLVRHCAPSLRLPPEASWTIGRLNCSLSSSVDAGWGSLESICEIPPLVCRPPEYSLNGSVLGRFASVYCPKSDGYIAVCLVRGFEGDIPAPVLLLKSKRALSGLAWEIGIAFTLSPSRRVSAVMAAFSKCSHPSVCVYPPPALSLARRLLNLFS